MIYLHISEVPDYCLQVFNAKMMDDPEKPRTMWRITSNGDFGVLISCFQFVSDEGRLHPLVATCLPELGDYTSISVSPSAYLV